MKSVARFSFLSLVVGAIVLSACLPLGEATGKDCEYYVRNGTARLPPASTVTGSISFLGGDVIEISYETFAGPGFGYFASLGYRITPETNPSSFIHPTTHGSSLNELVASKGWEAVWKSLPKTGFEAGVVDTNLPHPFVIERSTLVDSFGTYSPGGERESVYVVNACKVRRSRRYLLSDLIRLTNARNSSERVFSNHAIFDGIELRGTLHVAAGYPNSLRDARYGWTLGSHTALDLTISVQFVQHVTLHPSFFRAFLYDRVTDDNGCLFTRGLIASDYPASSYLLPDSCKVLQAPVPLDFSVAARPGGASWEWSGLSTRCDGDYAGSYTFTCDVCKRAVASKEECPSGELTPNAVFSLEVALANDDSHAGEGVVVEGTLWQGVSRGHQYFQFPFLTAFGNGLQLSAAWRFVNYDRDLYSARFDYLRLYRPTRPGSLPTAIQLIPETSLGRAYDFTPFNPDEMAQYLHIARQSPDVFLGFWMNSQYIAENGFGVWTLEADIVITIHEEKAQRRATLGIETPTRAKAQKEFTLPRIKKQFGVWWSTFHPTCDDFDFSPLCLYDSRCDWDWEQQLCYEVKEPSMH